MFALQSGQALVLALVFLTMGAAGLLQLFNGGQLIHEKTRLTNAVDAAAYSGAVVQARAFNFLAYTNRAVLAHQVAMAHAVTLASWAKFGDTQAKQLARSNPPSSLIGGLFGPAHGRGYAGARGLAGVDSQATWNSGALARAFAEHDRLVHEVLVRAQVAVQQSLEQTRDAAMRSVLAANYDGENVVLDPHPISDSLPGFVTRYGGAARNRIKGMVEQANKEYPFLGPRNHDRSSLIPTEARCPWLRHALRRRGSTTMQGFDGWSSLDTEAFHALRSNKWIGCYYREYPMGYGAVKSHADLPDSGVEYVADPPENFADQDFWRWVRQSTSWDILAGTGNPLANSWAMAGQVQWSGRGLPSYVEISDAGRSPQSSPSLRFAIRASRAQAALHTTDARAPKAGAGKLEFKTLLAGNVMAAASAAETFYERPFARRDGRYERANLYQPYWQARLVSLSNAERERVRAMQELR